MWNLPKPDISQVKSQLESVLPSGAAPILLSAKHRTSLNKLYLEYATQAGRPSTAFVPGGLSKKALKAILGAYSEVKDRGRLGGLRSDLMLDVDACPYCGFGEIRDLDHHLQKARFKCFSIFPLNLVPTCSKCNGHKPKIPRADPAKHHVHAYLDDLSAHDFLRADVVLTKTAMSVSFRIEQSAGMSVELFSRLKQHLEDFRLNSRFRAQVNIFMCEQGPGIKSAYKGGGAANLRSLLLDGARDYRVAFGPNDWRCALYTELAAHSDFCNGGFRKAIQPRVKKRPRAAKTAGP